VSLKNIILSFIKKEAKNFRDGILVNAMVNHIAKNYEYETEEVKTQIEKMINEKVFIAAKDDRGTFIKINGI
jgi:predicted nucleic-acid-binding protein